MRRYGFAIFSLLILVLPKLGFSAKEIEGMQVPETFEELIDPKHCAILVVDMQNDWASTQGKIHRKDKAKEPDQSKHSIVPGYAKQVKNLEEFLKAAREVGVQITYAEIIHKDKRGASVQTGFDFYMKPELKYAAIEGTWGAKTVKELAPQKGDFVIQKIRGNTFYKTYLEDYLKDRSIRTVLMTGTATGGCVAATAFGAFERGFFTVMVRDCIDQHGTPMFQWLESTLPIYTSDELVSAWKKMEVNHE